VNTPFQSPSKELKLFLVHFVIKKRKLKKIEHEIQYNFNLIKTKMNGHRNTLEISIKYANFAPNSKLCTKLQKKSTYIKPSLGACGYFS